MLEFTCVSCGKRIQGDETLTGKRVQCPACRMATRRWCALATPD